MGPPGAAFGDGGGPCFIRPTDPRTSMKDLAPEYMARSGEGLREAADARFTMAPFFRAAMPGSTTRVM